MPRTDCTVLVASCDRYADVLAHFAALFTRFWPDCPFPVALVTESDPTTLHPSPFTLHPSPFTRVIATGRGKSWSAMLTEALAALDTPYVLLLMDDYYLEAPVSTPRVLARLEQAKALRALSLRLIPKPPAAAPLAGSDPPLGVFPPNTAYCVSCQASLWDRAFLAGIASRTTNAWEFERRGSYLIDEADRSRPLLVTPTREFPFVDAVHKGYWEPFGVAVCERNGLTIDFARRPRPPLKVRLVEGLKALVFRLVPTNLLVRLQNRFALGFNSRPPARRLLLLLLACAACLRATGEGVAFTAALTNGTEWAYSESVRLYVEKNGGNVYLNAEGAEVRSPVFPWCIKEVEFACRYSTANTARPVALIPLVDGQRRDDQQRTIADGSGAIASNHVWSAAARVNGFVVRSGKGNGSFSLVSARIRFHGTPEDLTVAAQYRDGFVLDWRNPPDARSATVCVSRFVETRDAFTTLAAWDFRSVANAGGSPTSIAATFAADWPGLSCAGVVQLAKASAGFIQIGNNSTKGTLVVDAVPEGAEYALLRGGIPTASYGKTMPVEWTADGETNALAVLKLAPGFGDYLVPLFDVPPGAALLFQSTTSKHIVNVASLRLVRDYAPAATNLIEVLRLNVGTAQRKKVAVEEPGAYLCRVFATLGTGEASCLSDPVTLTLSPDDPPLPLGFRIHLR